MLEIPEPVAQAILDYLADQPYREVFHLVQQIQRLKPVGEAEESKHDGTE